MKSGDDKGHKSILYSTTIATGDWFDLLSHKNNAKSTADTAPHESNYL